MNYIELWYINGNRSSVHRACGIGSTLMNFIAKAEEKQRGRYHLNRICLFSRILATLISGLQTARMQPQPIPL